MVVFSLFTNCKKNILAIVFLCFLIVSCGDNSGSTDSTKAKKAVIVKPYTDYKGKFHKGHVRMPINANKNAVKNRIQSKKYYHTKGKYLRKKK